MYYNFKTNKKIENLEQNPANISEIGKSSKDYKSFLESSPISMALINLNGKIIGVNSATEDLIRIKREDLLGKYGIEFVHPEDKKRVLLCFQQAMKSGEGSVEARIKHKNGSYIWIE